MTRICTAPKPCSALPVRSRHTRSRSAHSFVSVPRTPTCHRSTADLPQRPTKDVSTAGFPAVFSGLGNSQALSTAAHALGWLVVAGSWFRSVPQIARILKNKSVLGLSGVSIAVETVAYTIIVAYNTNHGYPFSTYGDVFAVWLQDIVISALFLYYTKPSMPMVLFLVLGYTALSWYIISGACGMEVLTILQVCVGGLLMLGSRVPQIVKNWKRHDTGELSLVSSALSAIGNLVRVITTAVLTSDMILLVTTSAAFVLNSILTAQCFQTEMRLRKVREESRASA